VSQNRLAKDKFLLSVADFAIPDDHKTMLAEVCLPFTFMLLIYSIVVLVLMLCCVVALF